MSMRNNIIGGLAILEKYDENGPVEAHLDTIFGSLPEIEVSAEDAQTLRKMGWLFSDDDGWMFET